jgi:hypothetical protein
MKYTVVWKPEAERRLTELWLEAVDPEGLANAANLIERELALVPASVGEQREGGERVVMVPPGAGCLPGRPLPSAVWFE